VAVADRVTDRSPADSRAGHRRRLWSCRDHGNECRRRSCRFGGGGRRCPCRRATSRGATRRDSVSPASETHRGTHGTGPDCRRGVGNRRLRVGADARRPRRLRWCRTRRRVRTRCRVDSHRRGHSPVAGGPPDGGRRREGTITPQRCHPCPSGMVTVDLPRVSIQSRLAVSV
jgi:hypothetical protein